MKTETKIEAKTELASDIAKGRIKQLELTGITQYDRIVRIFNNHLLYNYTHLSFKPILEYFRREEAKPGITKHYLKLQKCAILRAIIDTHLKHNNFKKIAEYREFFKIFKYQPKRKKDTAETLPSFDELVKCMVYASHEERVHIKGLFSSGLRNIEYRNIRLDKCYLKKNSLSVEVIGKGKYPRIVPFPVEVYQYALKKYKGHVYLFESVTGKPMSRITLQTLIRSAAKRVNMKFTPRTLRKAGLNYIADKFPNFPQDALCAIYGHTRSVQDTYYRIHKNRDSKIYKSLAKEINSKIQKVRSNCRNSMGR